MFAKDLVLRADQERGVDFLFERDAAGLFVDPGLGKSIVSLMAFKELKAEGVVSRLLIIAPLSVCQIQWPNEIRKWKQTKHFTFGILHGKSKQEVWDLKPDILIINPEGLKWLVTKANAPDFPDALVVDESTSFKNSVSKRFRLLKKILPKFRHRVILTGSALAERHMDLFGQIRILDDGSTFGKYVTQFRGRYFNRDNWEVYASWSLKPGAAEEIQEKIAPYVLRLKAEDYIDMPKVIETTIPVNLPKNAEAEYAEFLEELILKVKRRVITSKNPGTTGNKLRQILSGWVYDDEGYTVEIHTAKRDALQVYLEEQAGNPVLVGFEYEHEGEALSEDLGAPRIDGSTKPADRVKLVEQWNAGELPVLLGHPASMAHGLNLQYGGSAIAWYTLPWSFEQYDQFNRRLNRAGQTRPVTIHHFISQLGSGLQNFDEYVLGVLQNKRDVQDHFYDWLEGNQP